MDNASKCGALRVFEWRFILTPITVTWIRYSERVIFTDYSATWRELYIFGIRIARWRADAP